MPSRASKEMVYVGVDVGVRGGVGVVVDAGVSDGVGVSVGVEAGDGVGVGVDADDGVGVGVEAGDGAIVGVDAGDGVGIGVGVDAGDGVGVGGVSFTITVASPNFEASIVDVARIIKMVFDVSPAPTVNKPLALMLVLHIPPKTLHVTVCAGEFVP